MNKIFILASFLHLGTSLSTYANPAASDALLNPSTQLPEMNSDAVKMPPSDSNIPPILSVPTESTPKKNIRGQGRQRKYSDITNRYSDQ